MRPIGPEEGLSSPCHRPCSGCPRSPQPPASSTHHQQPNLWPRAQFQQTRSAEPGVSKPTHPQT
eukprot:2273777-Alexandrium_andersonii.AAC.1